MYIPVDKSCKEPKERYFIEADIQPHFCNRKYFGVQKAKNGDRGTIVYSAALKRPLPRKSSIIVNTPRSGDAVFLLSEVAKAMSCRDSSLMLTGHRHGRLM